MAAHGLWAISSPRNIVRLTRQAARGGSLSGPVSPSLQPLIPPPARVHTVNGITYLPPPNLLLSTPMPVFTLKPLPSVVVAIPLSKGEPFVEYAGVWCCRDEPVLILHLIGQRSSRTQSRPVSSFGLMLKTTESLLEQSRARTSWFLDETSGSSAHTWISSARLLFPLVSVPWIRCGADGHRLNII